ncbi:methyltransferase domain-containing protein [Caenimonas sedimenti]|nr:methyltransferase domain-containing protein [Caenimonas sedimenti]
MNHPALLSFACGFASLSLEILWVRLYGFTKSSTPVAFGFVLAAYLLGIALGASLGARACRRATTDAQLWRWSLAALLVSAALSPLLPALFGALTSAHVQNPLVDIFVIGLASAILSFVFPIAHHLGTRHFADRQGQRFALVYTANVSGAALGPLVTGYVLLDTLSVQQCFLLLGAAQAAAAAALALAVRQQRAVLVGVAALLAGSMAIAAQSLEPHRLVRSLTPKQPVPKTVVENRHGIVTIFPGELGDDVVYGGNVYDGRTNLDPQRNTNGLERPLLMAALHPEPKRVLMVGLSIGTWLAIVREFPGVETIDVVEINPGYVQAAQAYPAQAAAMRDPRVNVVIDDARRWLRHRPERKYDMVIMNTTLHWRSNASLLLSSEFLRLIRSHMAPGAVLTFNATSSGDAFLTAARVFPHAYRYRNFVYAADFDFRPRKDAPRTREVYANLRLDGQPFFTPGSAAIDVFMRIPFLTVDLAQNAAGRRFEEVTDYNMITEFKYGRKLYFWPDLFSF